MSERTENALKWVVLITALSWGVKLASPRLGPSVGGWLAFLVVVVVIGFAWLGRGVYETPPERAVVSFLRSALGIAYALVLLFLLFAAGVLVYGAVRNAAPFFNAAVPPPLRAPVVAFVVLGAYGLLQEVGRAVERVRERPLRSVVSLLVTAVPALLVAHSLLVRPDRATALAAVFGLGVLGVLWSVRAERDRIARRFRRPAPQPATEGRSGWAGAPVEQVTDPWPSSAQGSQRQPSVPDSGLDPSLWPRRRIILDPPHDPPDLQ